MNTRPVWFNIALVALILLIVFALILRPSQPTRAALDTKPADLCVLADGRPAHLEIMGDGDYLWMTYINTADELVVRMFWKPAFTQNVAYGEAKVVARARCAAGQQ